MRLYLVVTFGVLALVACGSSENPGNGGVGGSNGFGGTIASSGGRGGSETGGSRGGAVDGGGASGGSTGIDASLGNQTCAWLADCIAADNCSTAACIEACGAQASSTAIVQYSALIDCVSANPQCTTTTCLAAVCTEQLSACSGTAPLPQDAGAPAVFLDAATERPDAKDGPVDASPRTDAGAPTSVDAADVVALPLGPDAGPDVAGSGQGYTTSGRCDVVVKIPNLVDSHTCWDYTMTATANRNDGTEHYVAYNQEDVSGTQSACTSQTYSAGQTGPWDAAAISASNLSHKKQACDLSGSSYAGSSTWTEGSSCGLAGSLGHCTDTVTNAWDPSSQVLSSSLIGAWSVP